MKFVNNNFIYNIGLHSKMVQYLTNVDFWNPTHINKIKRPKGLSLLNSELKRALILVKQFSISMFYIIIYLNNNNYLNDYLSRVL